jgi:hypothetical protein
VTRELGITAFGLFAAMVIAAGCKPPENRIVQLEPYVGDRPSAVRPAQDLPKPVVQAPIPLIGENGWMPPGGIDGRWDCIVVHHSGSDTSTPEGMRDWHMNGRHWDELGYHFIIGNGVGYEDGAVFIGNRWPQQMHGAHCKTPDNYYNDHGIGICLIGDLNAHGPTPKQVKALARLAAFLSEKCNIPPSKILTHKGVTQKTECPGRQFSLLPVMQQMTQPPVTASSK